MINYNEIVIEHFKHPRNTGALTPGPNVIYARSGLIAMECLIEWYWQIDFASLQVVEVRYRVYGDTITIALCSWISVWLKNKTLAEITTLTPELLIQTLLIPSRDLPRVIAVVRSVEEIVGLSVSCSENRLIK